MPFTRIRKLLERCLSPTMIKSSAEFDDVLMAARPSLELSCTFTDCAPAEVVSQTETLVFCALSMRKAYTRPLQCWSAVSSISVNARAKSRTLTVIRCPAGASSCHGCLLDPHRDDVWAVMWIGSVDVTDTVHERSSSTTACCENVYFILLVSLALFS